MSKVYDASKVPAVVTLSNNTEETIAIELIPFGIQNIPVHGSMNLTINDSEILLVTMLRARDLGLATEINQIEESQVEESKEVAPENNGDTTDSEDNTDQVTDPDLTPDDSKETPQTVEVDSDKEPIDETVTE